MQHLHQHNKRLGQKAAHTYTASIVLASQFWRNEPGCTSGEMSLGDKQSGVLGAT